MENIVRGNKKVGLVVRNSSSGEIKRNSFEGNGIEILVENNKGEIKDIDVDNILP